jgi:tetratricopeptide (TPR) repeat protein
LKGARRAALGFALLLAGRGEGQEPDPSFLRRLVEDLDASSQDARRNAAASLRAEGEAAVPVLLEGFEEASVQSRRARARLLVESPASLDAALARIDDPDPGVRAEWARLFGRRDVPRETIGVRVSALSHLAADPDRELRERALEGLRSLDDPVAGRALADLACDPDPDVREQAIAHLSRAPSARPWLPEVAGTLEGGVPAHFVQVLVPLGRAVAVLDARGDEEAAQSTLAIFARTWRHPDRVLARWSRRGFADWIEGLNARGLADRAAARIEDLARRTGDPPISRSVPDEEALDLEHLGLGLLLEKLGEEHLYETRDLDRARVAARAMAERGEGIGGLAGGRYRARGLALEATCDLLQGRASEAEDRFRRALDLLDRALRGEVEEGMRAPPGALLATLDLVQVRMLRSLNALLHPGDAATEAGPLDPRDEFRCAWEAFPGVEKGESFDNVLLRRLGVERVIREALLPRCGSQPTTLALRTLARWLHELSPEEFLSLEGEGQDSVPRRRGQGEPFASGMSRFPLRVVNFEATELGLREESLVALDRFVEELQTGRQVTASSVDLLAETLLARGRLFLDLRRGAEAAASLRAGVELLEQFAEAGRPGIARGLANAYVSLAVNENVVRGNRAAAREYCRKARELDDSDFTRVLFACYLARDGKREEALEELSRVPPGPETYYNAACTYALLGEVEAAFESLSRDFEERGARGGSLASHREWTWQDPDLRSLRPDPRFQEIVGPPPPAGP